MCRKSVCRPQSQPRLAPDSIAWGAVFLKMALPVKFVLLQSLSKIGSYIDIRYFEVVKLLVHFTQLEQQLKFKLNYKHMLQLLYSEVTKYKLHTTKCHTY